MDQQIKPGTWIGEYDADGPTYAVEVTDVTDTHVQIRTWMFNDTTMMLEPGLAATYTHAEVYDFLTSETWVITAVPDQEVTS